jgi:hypothetical protein
LCAQSAFGARNYSETLPSAARRMLGRRFPGWKFAEVNEEVRRFFETSMKGASPSLISGDFDGNGSRDYAAFISHGSLLNYLGKAIGPRHYLVVFLRKGARYRMYVMKDADGEYLSLGRKGTKDYNYEEQKEIIYANDAVQLNYFEKAGASYVYEKGRFRAFVSSD